jgi:hypothetical protein
MLALSLQLTSCGDGQTPETLFREAVLNPIPASVQIINATRRTKAGDIEIWIHFKISSADFDTVWSSEHYKTLESSAGSYSANGPPDWWVPERLGPNQSFYDCETKPHLGRDRSAKHIIVNARQDEVLFLLESWYNY